MIVLLLCILFLLFLYLWIKQTRKESLGFIPGFMELIKPKNSSAHDYKTEVKEAEKKAKESKKAKDAEAYAKASEDMKNQTEKNKNDALKSEEKAKNNLATIESLKQKIDNLPINNFFT